MKIAVSVASTIFKYYCIRTYMDTALKRKQNVPAIRRGLVFFTAFFLPPAFPNLGLPGNFLLLLSLNLLYVWCNYNGKKWKLLFHTMLLQIIFCLCEYPVLMVSAWLLTEEQRQEEYVIRILMLMSWGCCRRNDYCDSQDFSFFPEKRDGEAGLDADTVSGMLQCSASVFSEYTAQLQLWCFGSVF